MRVEQGLELLVERAGALRQRDELRDARELAVAFGVFEPAGELLGERTDVHPEHGDEPSGKQGLGDIRVVHLVCGGGQALWLRELVVQDLPLQLSQLRARLEAPLVERAMRGLEGRSRRLRPAPRVRKRAHQLKPEPTPRRIRAIGNCDSSP